MGPVLYLAPGEGDRRDVCGGLAQSRLWFPDRRLPQRLVRAAGRGDGGRMGTGPERPGQAGLTPVEPTSVRAHHTGARVAFPRGGGWRGGPLLPARLRRVRPLTLPRD